MQTELSRLTRRRRQADTGAALVAREAWGPLLLAGASLMVGAFFQDPVSYGWLAGAAAAMLLVRVAITFEPPEPAVKGTPLPTAPMRAFLRGGAGLAVAALLYWLVPSTYLSAAWALTGLALIALGRGSIEYPLRFAGAVALLLAAGHVGAVDSFPNFMGVPPSLTLGGVLLRFQVLRQIGFGVVALSGLAAIWAYRPGSGERAVWAWLAVATHLTILWMITDTIADAIQLMRGATSAGNEALWIATAWGLYGLTLVLTAPRVARELPWLKLGQAVFTCALGFLLMGGMMANARWADASVRMAAYAGVPGAIWLAFWVQRRRGSLTEPDRLLALAATAMGFGICSFEVLRWLEPRFTYPSGSVVTQAMLARDHNLLNGLSLAVWAVYCLLVFGAGAWLRSRSLRYMGTVLALSGALYLLFWLVG